MKACLIHSGRDPIRTRDLLKLQGSMPSAVAQGFDPNDLDTLNPWTIEGRYPDDLDAAAAIEARICIEAAEHVIRAANAVISP